MTSADLLDTYARPNPEQAEEIGRAFVEEIGDIPDQIFSFLVQCQEDSTSSNAVHRALVELRAAEPPPTF